MAKHMDRAKSRYGHKDKESKSFKDKDHADWDQADAKAYMNSKEGQEHQAMQARAQELMQPQQSDESPQMAMPNAGAAASMPAQGA